ncbi:hypothetical protein [endosymbiont GvMRE of Glomus versiforme]|uniref:hypothetical protein n=1 Tax=endosymbiont GvMRE of Glomus versiforme TaxID=2039283 RepID=UPI000EDA5CF6|nr:hypothetical protein [endosymbiont GvMRE of Glomus versiforme]RHZ37517.1 hypothetical protein GvMRE_I1g406 [endosymbiont GvMRE of Glomus versiforme]
MEKWKWIDWLDKGEIRLTDTLLADIKKEKSHYGNTFFVLHLVKGNETYEVIAFVGKEEITSLEERVERKLNSLSNIKKLIIKQWEDNIEIMEQLTKLEEQVELIKKRLKENTATDERKKKSHSKRKRKNRRKVK